MSVNCEVKQYKAMMKQLAQMQKAPKTVLQRTLSDVNKRVPGWIASEVVKEYGVKKSEITGNKLGEVKVRGDSIETVEIVYTGRLLTPTHFGMTPKVPGRNAYTLKASIIKGQKATLGKVKKLTKKQRVALGKNFRREGTRTSQHSPIMLQHTGAKSGEKTQYIPFQRKHPGSTKTPKLNVIKTVSLPQMVGGDRTHEGITKTINENLGKRLEHHMKLLDK